MALSSARLARVFPTHARGRDFGATAMKSQVAKPPRIRLAEFWWGQLPACLVTKAAGGQGVRSGERLPKGCHFLA